MRHLGAPQRVVLNQYNIKPQFFPSTNFRNLRFKPNPSSSKWRKIEDHREPKSCTFSFKRGAQTKSDTVAAISAGQDFVRRSPSDRLPPGLKIVRQEHTPHHKHDAQNTAETMDNPERNGTVRIHPEGETLIINRLTAHDLPDV